MNTLQKDTKTATEGDRSGRLVTWMATAVAAYLLFSGLAIRLLPFAVYAQYSVLLHSAVGLLALLPIIVALRRHASRRSSELQLAPGRIAFAAYIAVAAALASGLLVTVYGLVATRVPDVTRLVHLLAGLAAGLLLAAHVVRRYPAAAGPRPQEARSGGARGAAGVTIALLMLLPAGLAGLHSGTDAYRAFADDYDWPHGDDRPFWPSRAGLAEPPWKTRLLGALSELLEGDQVAAFRDALRRPGGRGVRELAATLAVDLDLDEASAATVAELADSAASAQRTGGALAPQSMSGSEGCGSSGCHVSIYAEWRVSAHGYSATDSLFREVQALLAAEQGVAATRSCAGCHDPVALLSGARHGGTPADEGLRTFEGNSCLVCHRTVVSDTEGNGGFVIDPPEPYLFERATAGIAAFAGRYLIRVSPEAHTEAYARPLYRESSFCAGCHKQVPAPADATAAGLAQEQNEYDSWKESRWYHGEDDARTIECRECHMRLVTGDDPARGDSGDSYRSSDDGSHRSHRFLASNMYMPVQLGIPGGEEQARLTIDWLQGEIDVPEIADRWATGPVVRLEIVAPDQIAPGELVNIELHLHNDKTGHDFPAGPLDVLESWVELSVDDDRGNRLLELGAEQAVDPSVDAPVVYKADWYDRQGLPVERHDLWDVVGASYRRVIRSGGSDVVDVPFRCPGIARPRLSASASETGPGERRSDVVFALERDELAELSVTARLLFRKANPAFLAAVYDLEDAPPAPVVELARATHKIRVAPR